MTIRPATVADAPELLRIYLPYILETAITFELDDPGVDDFRHRIEEISAKFPYLVAEEVAADGTSHILGYTYAHTFRERHAYDHCVEMSIYVEKDCRRGGVGTKLYEALEVALKKQGIINLCASITTCDHPSPYVDDQSIRFHEKFGYTKVAHFHKCGHKFNDWFDMIWMEKFLADHAQRT